MFMTLCARILSGVQFDGNRHRDYMSGYISLLRIGLAVDALTAIVIQVVAQLGHLDIQSLIVTSLLWVDSGKLSVRI